MPPLEIKLVGNFHKHSRMLPFTSSAFKLAR
jgi:hypothetical protein